MNPPSPTCPTCGGIITVAGPGGNCPRCLLAGMDALFAAPLEEEWPAPELPQVPRHVLYEKLGEGGFGVVYRARQTEPVERAAAVKLLKNTAPSREVIARFTAESRALARLQHPGIAAIHDAGATHDGRLYFSMEFVEGRPLSAWLLEDKPALRARLRLVAAVCDAVEHAHQRGIIHRDLKPSNVLVDTAGAPHVIDFGLAKATEPEAAPHSLLTLDRDLLGTPGYMSPEQARGGSLAVDTRSDVYALGAVLYELLTGRPPFTQEGVSQMELLRRVYSETPVPPSRLDRTLPADLDWIVLRALEKEPTHRYQSVAALRDDVLAWLEGKPVTARAPSLLYRTRKFTRRHWLPVSIAAALFTAIVAGAIISAVYAARATAQRERADAAARETVRVFSQADFHAAGELARAGEPAEAVARLCRALRSDPANTTAAAALTGLLLHTSFPQKSAPPLAAGGRVDALHWRGREVIAVCNDGAVRMGSDHSLTEHRAAVRGFLSSHWLPALSLLATGTRTGQVEVWDLAAGRRSAGPLTAETPALIREVRLAPDGKMVFATAHDGSVNAWSLPGGERRWSFHKTDANALAVHGSQIAAGARDGRITVLDTSGTVIAALEPPQSDDSRKRSAASRVTVLDFSTDGQLLAAGHENGAVRLWNATTHQPATPPLLHSGQISALVFSSGGQRLATASLDGTARIWNAADGRAVTPWLQHADSVYTLVFSPGDHAVATGSRDSAARLWDAQDGRLLAAPMRHARSVTSLAFNETGTHLATGGRDGIIRQWDVRPRAALPREIKLPRVAWAGFDPADDMLLAWTADRQLHRFDSRTGQPLSPPAFVPGDARHRDTMRQNDAFFDALTHAGLPKYTAMAAGAMLAGFKPLQSPVFIIEPQSWRLAAVRPDGSVVLYELHPPRRMGELPAQSPPAKVIALAPGGRKGAAGFADGSVRLFDAGTLQWTHFIAAAHAAAITSLRFSPGGTLFATAAADNSARLWKTATASPHGAPLPHDDIASTEGLTARFNGDGTLLLTAGSQDLTLRRWRTADATPAAPPLYLGDQISAWRAHGSGLLWCGVAGAEGRGSYAQAFDLLSGEALTPPLRHRRALTWMAVSRDGTLGAAVSESAILLWPLPPRCGLPKWFPDFAEKYAGISLNDRGALTLEEFPPDKQQMEEFTKLLGAPLR